MSLFQHVTFCAKTDIGRKRKNNEDACYAKPSYGLWVVSDGMGGGDDGEVASLATVQGVEKFVKEHAFPSGGTWGIDDLVKGLGQAATDASAWIYARAREKHLKGCGATFVGLLLDAANPEEAVALHAGDSRLYRIRGRSIQQITRDHSAAEMIGAKNEAEINPMFRGMILRAVGIQPTVELERTALPLKPGDWVLICSDGLSRMVSDKQIVSIVRDAANPDDGVRMLISAANEAGGIDNITAVLVKVGEFPPPVASFPLVLPERQPTACESPPSTTHTGETTDSMPFDLDPSSVSAATGATASTLTAGESELACVESVSALANALSTSAASPSHEGDDMTIGQMVQKRRRTVFLVLSAVLVAALISALLTWYACRQVGMGGGLGDGTDRGNQRSE